MRSRRVQSVLLAACFSAVLVIHGVIYSDSKPQTTSLAESSGDNAWGTGFMKDFDRVVSRMAGTHETLAEGGHGKGAEGAGKGAEGAGKGAEGAGKGDAEGASSSSSHPERPKGEPFPGEFHATHQHAEPAPAHGLMKHIDEEVSVEDVKHAFEGQVFDPDSKVIDRFHHLRKEYKEAREVIEHQLHGTNMEASVLTFVLFLIVILSVLVEAIFEFVENNTSEEMRTIVQTVFQELTVMGFISLFVFFAVRSGIAPFVSDHVFGTETELMETFELVHMFVFLFMMIFVSTVISQALILTKIKNKRKLCEQKCIDRPQEIEIDYLYWYVHPVARWDLPSRWKRDKAVYEMEYSVLRGRFLHQLMKDKLIESSVGFDFAFYLEGCNNRGLAHSIDIQPLTWIFLIFLLIPLRGFIAIKSFPVKLTILFFLSAALFLMPHLTLTKLQSVRRKLHGVPKLGSNSSEDELSEALSCYSDETPLVDAFMQLDPPYLREADEPKPGRRSWLTRKLCGDEEPSEHLRLFWFENNGPTVLYHILRQAMFFNSIYLAALIVRFAKYAWRLHPVTPFLLVVFPLTFVFFVCMKLLNEICVVTSIGMFRDQVALKDTLLKAKTAKIVHALRMMKQMRMSINSLMGAEINKLSRGAGFEGIRLEELREIFEKADTDNSGKLSGSEVREMFVSRGMGADMSEDKRQLQLDSIDPSWEFSFEDFTSMVKDMDQGKTAGNDIEALVECVFGMLDQDDTGSITVNEFMQMLCGPDASDAERESGMIILQEADTDGDGMVDKEELTALLTKYAAKMDLEDGQ